MHRTVAAMIGAALFFAPLPLFAQSSAILGTEDYFAGALPPPGFHFIDYLAYYTADELRDADGKKVPLDFELDVLADVLRPIYVSDIEVLGANLAWHAVIPVVYQAAKVKDFGASDYQFGLGDMYISPFLLGWHGDIFHCVAGLDIITPTGQYDREDFASIGNNHWTFEPAVAVSMIHPDGFGADLKLMYDIHTKNTDDSDDDGSKIDTLTGQQFHLDYNAGVALLDQLRLGVCGYFLIGLQNDEWDGEEVEDSKEQVFAVGPSVMFQASPSLGLVAKAQFETYAENRPLGTMYWLKAVASF